ncbi:Gfo/Idh/MocA family protein [Streptomyces sp. NPDC004752]
MTAPGPGRVGVALVGAGVISTVYLKSLTAFPDVQVLGVADLDVGRARAQAARFGVPVAGDVETVLAVPEVEIVVNLTIPAAHTEVAVAALAAGKHVYGEKPLAPAPSDGAKILAEASSRGLRVGCAPDTFLGAGLQAAARALHSGAIGEPVSATAVVQGPGPESWHPSPEFLYQHGGGPLFDIGPYYLTALVALLGPVGKVAAGARQARDRRVIGSGPRAGTEFAVDVPTHVHALLDFDRGPSAAATFSFDSAAPRHLIEITGTEGTLALPDPNTFGGPLRVREFGAQDWRDLPVDGSVGDRGVGVLDLARAIRTGAPHRASGDLAHHVLDLMTSITGAADRMEFVSLESRVDPPAVLPADWDPAAPTLV